MKISYDSDVDAMYITLIEGEYECRTVRLSDEIALDFGPNETLVGIEILDAKRLLGKGKLPRLVVDNLDLEAAQGAVRRNSRQPVKATAITGRRVRKAG